MDDDLTGREFTALDRAMGGALFVVVLVLGYIALDTMAAGAITRTISPSEAPE